MELLENSQHRRRQVIHADNPGPNIRKKSGPSPVWRSRVLARPKQQGTAPCHFSSVPCRFFCALSFSESALVSSVFYHFSSSPNPEQRPT